MNSSNHTSNNSVVTLNESDLAVEQVAVPNVAILGDQSEDLGNNGNAQNFQNN
ncbi:MAG: hypothetical protein WCK82_12915 [Bacteroidota bacterium]|jgi:hypothetical protein